MIKPLLIFSSSLLAASLSQQVQAQDPSKYYEALICNDCSYTEAKAIVAKLSPALECQQDVFDPDVEMQCYSASRKVVIFNAATRTSYAFSNGHDNQGRPIYEMSNYVRDIDNLPQEVDVMFNEVVNSYQALSQIARQLSSNVSQPSFGSSKVFSARAANETTSCENSPEFKALQSALNGRNVSNVRLAAQDLYTSSADFKNSFTTKQINGISFSVSKDSFGLGGSWQYVATSNRVIQDFTSGSDVPGQMKNQVGFKLSLDNGLISADVEEKSTMLDGISLHELRNNNYDINQVSNCLGEALDKFYPKAVGSPGGGMQTLTWGMAMPT